MGTSPHVWNAGFRILDGPAYNYFYYTLKIFITYKL